MKLVILRCNSIYIAFNKGSQSRLHIIRAVLVSLSRQIILISKSRSRTDHAHIPKLWQFINARFRMNAPPWWCRRS
ncbi:MAG: hypothetical protein IKG82_07180 [Oscillospiraceae bacterium]|nr:hypothetical protein [Oscillospiraceae bacterium]